MAEDNVEDSLLTVSSSLSKSLILVCLQSVVVGVIEALSRSNSHLPRFRHDLSSEG